MYKSGFVSIIGNANVGKSTLLNKIIGEKVMITSSKPQTTRNTIRGIYNDKESQVVFIDTPGLHQPRHALGEMMDRNTLKTLGNVDLVIYMVDATADKDMLDDRVIEALKVLTTPTLLVINKIDKAKDIDRLEKYINTLKEKHDFAGVFAVSAKTGKYVDNLKEDIKSHLEEGPAYYPTDITTDQPEKFLIAELIREKVLNYTHEEIPHSVAVVIDALNEDPDIKDLLNIHATVVVERESQKGIIIGKGGSMLKKIGTAARKDILNLLDSPVYLDLHCKVIKDWRNKDIHLRNLGYSEDDRT